ncbi:MAG: DNA polymerase III subunit beta [Puniceicoccales bacterium]|jgi:DNA polymerase-3 subunit beta|nr:DNA polymerase III subunit beta [Puniceicoccales bacterium]
MKFIISKNAFSDGLQQVLHVVNTRASLPILSHVKIDVYGRHVTLTTTNLDLGIQCHMAAVVESEGSVTLPVKKLATIVKALPGSEVSVEEGSKAQITLRAGASTFKISGLGAEEFPKLSTFTEAHEMQFEQNKLKEMLCKVSYAQSHDENRYLLNGVFFSFEDEALYLVATDGRRLGLVRKVMGERTESYPSIILPARTVSELERLLGHGKYVHLKFNEKQVSFDIAVDVSDEKEVTLEGSIELISKVVEGRYPNYRQVLPSSVEHRVKIDRALLLEIVQRVALVASERNYSVCLRMADQALEVSAKSSEYGEAHESFPISYDETPVEIAFNPQFLIEPLRTLQEDDVFFEFKDEMSPGVLKTLEDFSCVIMPLRLR